ncbi:MAG: electron transfer flavoprotein-ubiquinone oxidoreductase [Deltaproteobacteria bacterium]|nr:electron transfer flavoprotein-ubiquinone oxidoreductase [Deltaproteobacteria bacterium]
MSEREILEVDFLFVGAGPANLSSAIALKKKIDLHNQISDTPVDDPMIVIIEKAAELGGHQISGAVINPGPLSEIIPDYMDRGCPFESPVTQEAVYYLTPKGQFKFPILPPQFKNHGNYVASLSKFTAWLGEQAMELGIEIFPGFTGTEVLYNENKVIGVRTGDKGVDAQGNPKPNFEQGMDIHAKCTIFGEGVRGYLTKQLIPHLKLEGQHPQIFETGVKEVWECKKPVKPGLVMHTMGYPLDRHTIGGSFVYGMQNNHLVIGLVVSLDYKDPLLEPYAELQKLKNHPLIQDMIKDGKQVAYGAKAISAGGYYSMPQLTFDGGMIVGEAGQLLDIARLKGVHIGMRSGITAADTLFDIFRKDQSFTHDNLRAYQHHFLQSDEGKQLFTSRNFHQALAKGLPKAFFHIGAQTVTGGRGFQDPMPIQHIDRDSYDTVEKRYGQKNIPLPAPIKADTSINKLSSVYNSGTVHEEDQISHLKIQDTQRCYTSCAEKYQSPCNRFCPAGVYEMLEENNQKKLQVNFTNCVHCQTCDINCPEDNILWTPPESGGGPSYKIL